MEEDSVFNSTSDDMDNFLNDIWSNVDLEPPDPDSEIATIHTGMDDRQMNSQTANVQSTVGNINREKFAMKEENVAGGSNSCALVSNQSANQNAGGPACENFVMKLEIITEGSSLCTRVSNQDVSGPCHKNFVRKGEVVTEGNNLCTLANNQDFNQSAAGPSYKTYSVTKGVSERNNLHTLVNNQSAGGPGRSVDRAEIRRRRMLKNRASAARSRARSLVRLTSLELEVKQYKEENAMLRQRKQRGSEQGNEQAPPKSDRKVRRCKSCSW